MKERTRRKPPNLELGDDAEREAAWEAFKAAQNAGWRSEGAYPSRDELHARGKSQFLPIVKTPPDAEQD